MLRGIASLSMRKRFIAIPIVTIAILVLMVLTPLPSCTSGKYGLVSKVSEKIQWDLLILWWKATDKFVPEWHDLD